MFHPVYDNNKGMRRNRSIREIKVIIFLKISENVYIFHLGKKMVELKV